MSGLWSDVMEISRKNKPREVLFDAHKSVVAPKAVSSESEQQPNESRRLWSKVTAAIKAKDLDRATEAKSQIEDQQREQAREREARGESFVPKYFKPTGKNGEWRAAFRCVFFPSFAPFPSLIESPLPPQSPLRRQGGPNEGRPRLYLRLRPRTPRRCRVSLSLWNRHRYGLSPSRAARNGERHSARTSRCDLLSADLSRVLRLLILCFIPSRLRTLLPPIPLPTSLAHPLVLLPLFSLPLSVFVHTRIHS